MKVFVTGTRGVPDIPGGVEKHCEKIYPLICNENIDIAIATRAPYVRAKHKQWRHIRLDHIYAPRKKSLEAVVHTFLAVLKARLTQSDIIHIHAVGPGLLVPLARILGPAVVVTNHGPDYDRQKWGTVARKMLMLGEYLGGKYAHEVIAISNTIGDIIRKRCGRASTIIPNGVDPAEKSTSTDYLQSIGVAPGAYLLSVCRFVPEKGLHLLIDAFENADLGLKLVIAGDADHESAYSRRIKDRIAHNPDIVHTGYITGDPLNQLFSNARLFILPSFHEGLPIALLEALSYELPVVVSDIPAHREIGLLPERYFKTGDAGDLTSKIEYHLGRTADPAEKEALKRMIQEKYNWRRIAEQTKSVYRAALQKKGKTTTNF